ncbi:hypothetical protein [Croceivirga thetidis]|uniref:Outer membrane protein beta-barrel domain-containing protein n=1 Tax=Croceivirga thetidis TaxID=2721623 RepID=A0ABX1GNM8_9FLAO|nr:hypothetical protein [Croceivirga thetidis]NKI30570.1 hypothetical protein [Croceivirga thetidis]
MRKIANLLLFLILAFNFCTAQESRNFFYVELGGAGPIGSVNYERQLTKDVPILARAGLGYVTTWGYSDFTIPLGLYHLSNLKNGNHLELGVTYTYAFNIKDRNGGGFFLPALGYRKFFERNKGFLKITFSPVIFNNDPVEILPWGGISFGTRF